LSNYFCREFYVRQMSLSNNFRRSFIFIISAVIFTPKSFSQLPFLQSFKDTVAPGIIFGGNPTAFLTANQTVSYPGGTITDGISDGYLRLTSAAVNERGYAYNMNAFPAIQGLKISFEYNTYGGGANAADGICFFLFHDTTNNFQMGGFGGSLGYTRRFTGGVLEPGLSGAYIGIGIDEYGNFCTYNESRYTGLANAVPNTITLRGIGDGSNDYWYNNVPNTVPNYDYITSVQTTSLSTAPFPIMGGDTRATSDLDTAYRRMEIDLAPRTITINGVTGTAYTISIRIITGSASGPVIHNIITNLNYDQIAPPNLNFGFAASTGGSFNYHEVRNIDIRAFNTIGSAPVATGRAEVVCSGNRSSMVLRSSVTPVNMPLGLDSNSLRFINPLNTLDTGTSYVIPGAGTITVDSNGAGTATFDADPGFTSGTATIRFVMRDNYGVISNPGTLTLTPSTGITNNTIAVNTGLNTISGSIPAAPTALTYVWEESLTDSATGFYAAPGVNNALDYSVTVSPVLVRWYRRTVSSGNCISSSNVQSFSADAYPLPLRLIAFNARPVGHEIALTWTTEKEEDIRKYELERAANNNGFKVIGSFAGKGNVTSSNYAFTDTNPVAGRNFYRLALHDRQGKTTYSAVISATIGVAGPAVSLYPDPASNVLNILSGVKGQVTIANVQGAALVRRNISAGENTLDITTLPSGIYYLSVESNTGRTVKRFTKL
jgi:hypothetical protein